MSQQERTAQEYQAVIAGCRDIFVKKNQDYGPSWSILRLPSITDQIYIKAERTRTLQETGVSMVGDDMDGEFRAIINYCAMALILLDIRRDHGGIFPDSLRETPALTAAYDARIHLAFTTMEKKNHDYGEAWRNMRVSSFTDLILMKLLRLKQIEDNQGFTLVSEGEDSNYIDILNYSVFALIQRQQL